MECPELCWWLQSSAGEAEEERHAAPAPEVDWKQLQVRAVTQNCAAVAFEKHWLRDVFEAARSDLFFG